MDDNALLAELERNLESEYGSDTQSVDSLSGIQELRASRTNSPATQSAESSQSNRSKRNSIEDLFSSEKVERPVYSMYVFCRVSTLCFCTRSPLLVAIYSLIHHHVPLATQTIK